MDRSYMLCGKMNDVTSHHDDATTADYRTGSIPFQLPPMNIQETASAPLMLTENADEAEKRRLAEDFLRRVARHDVWNTILFISSAGTEHNVH
ncbi:hypothetical protein WG66_008728 [Moniliophthora roreri]|nr:hypothetical protein WG66_008728 [Moniliophthora roreri]